MSSQAYRSQAHKITNTYVLKRLAKWGRRLDLVEAVLCILNRETRGIVHTYVYNKYHEASCLVYSFTELKDLMNHETIVRSREDFREAKKKKKKNSTL